MGYLGLTPTTAQQNYLNIDDISGSFNGSTTSFALQVGSVAPTPFPVTNSCLISVGGVIQEPDDTGTSGFRISGGNIVFSSAPGTGEDFFGLILAGADYLNIGANFPDGTVGTPSITFDSDTNTGIYHPSADELSFVTGGSDRVRVDSNGRLGIGTTSPSTLLDVRGSTEASIRWGTTSNFYGTLYADSSLTTVNSYNSNPLTFSVSTGTGYSEKARIDTSGRLLVGTSTARDNLFNGSTFSPTVQIETTTTSGRGLSIINNTSADTGAILVLAQSRGDSIGSNTALVSGRTVGLIDFQGNDGAEFVPAARIEAFVDGTPGADDMPGRLVFSTTADGASSPTERMRLNNVGALKVRAKGAINISGNETGSHELTTNNDGFEALYVTNTNSTSPVGIQIYYPTDINNTANYFLTCYGSSSLRAGFRSNGGLANYQSNNVNLSDINTKKDITLAAGTWDCIKEWEIVNYRYRDQPDDADLNLGVIAQQVAERCPEVVTVFSEAKEAKAAVVDDDGNEVEPAQEAQPEKLGVKEQQMMWMAIKALQEAQTRIETLEAEVAALKGA